MNLSYSRGGARAPPLNPPLQSTFVFVKIEIADAVPQKILTCRAGFILIASGVRALAWLKKEVTNKKKRKCSKKPMKCNISLYKVQRREFAFDLFATI